MPLVFVHGVANRLGYNYTAGLQTRDALFRRFLLRSHSRDDGGPVTVTNPYWGDLGAKLHWGGASLPLADVESLGSDDAALVELHASALPEGEGGPIDQAVLRVARRSLPDAVDLLWGASALAAPDGDELAALAVPVATYAFANPRPAWLADVRDDQQLVSRLQQELEAFQPAGIGGPEPPEWESLGIASAWNAIRGGLVRLRTAVAGVAGREASDRIRPAIIPGIANFLGDVFVYLHQQNEVGGPIRELVAHAIRTADTEAQPSDPLVLVAHSMGGNIVYDLLTGELADLPVPLLVTAGTQVGFFEELKLFRCSDPGVPGTGSTKKVAKPANIERWVNIFDYSDLLGFTVGTIIDGVDDFAYRTGSLLKAHGQYFLQPGFHDRLAARVRGER